MNFIIDAADLTHALRMASRAVGNGRTAPILGNVLIAADAESIAITGFDLEIGIRTTASPFSINAAGAITLPSRLTTDLASSLSGTLTVAAAGDTVTIGSASGTYTIQGMSADDYPDLPVAAAPPFSIPAAPFLDALAVALTAVSSDESKQALTGVNIAFGKVIEAAATDGHRLAMMTAGTMDTAATEATIPGRALSELRRLATAETLKITLDPGQVTFTSGPTTLTARTFTADYPAYRKLIPQTFEHLATLNRREFLAAAQRVAIMADQSNSVIRLTADDTKLLISAESDGLGSAGESIAAAITGTPKAAFNAHYLIDALKASSADTVTLQLNSPTTPAIITADDQPDFLYLIMPVQVRA